jgi:hypothetical protein
MTTHRSGMHGLINVANMTAHAAYPNSSIMVASLATAAEYPKKFSSRRGVRVAFNSSASTKAHLRNV